MQSDPRFFTGKTTPPGVYEMSGYAPSTGNHRSYGVPTAPSLDATLAGGSHGYPGPLNGVELQPSETCPKNFIIFDQTESKSRVMFHPALAQKFSYQNFDICGTHAQENGRKQGKNVTNHDKSSSTLKEDSDDIDALLSLEDEEEDNVDEDVVSTGRTPGNYGSNSPDSSCSGDDGSKSLKPRFPSTQCSTSGSTASEEKKKERMRKMVKTLRGIIPGGDQMDTPAVLDEAVRYLKSLKVEAKKLGIQSIKD